MFLGSISAEWNDIFIAAPPFPPSEEKFFNDKIIILVAMNEVFLIPE